MRGALVLALVLMGVPGGPAAAQENVSREARCWIGSSTFSAGAAMHVGDAVAVCDAGVGGWTVPPASIPAAGCLLEGKLSSTGAVMGIRNNDSLLLRCDADGQWITVETEPAV